MVEQNHDECGRFVGMCNLWQNFVGMSMEKFCGYEIFFCGYGIFAIVHGHGHVEIFSNGMVMGKIW